MELQDVVRSVTDYTCKINGNANISFHASRPANLFRYWANISNLLHIETITYADHVAYAFNGQHRLSSRFNDAFVYRSQSKARRMKHL